VADAIVLDVNMPGIDGGRAAEVIRAYRPRVKVLFHTAEVDGDLRRRAERLGAPILLEGDPGGTLDALDELLNGTPDHLDPRVALVVAALERNASDGVVIVDEELRLQFYDTGAAGLLGDPFRSTCCSGCSTMRPRRGMPRSGRSMDDATCVRSRFSRGAPSSASRPT